MQRRGLKPAKLRRRVYEVLEQGAAGDRINVAVNRFLILLIVINLVAVALESMPELAGTRRHASQRHRPKPFRLISVRHFDFSTTRTCLICPDRQE